MDVFAFEFVTFDVNDKIGLLESDEDFDSFGDLGDFGVFPAAEDLGVNFLLIRASTSCLYLLLSAASGDV